MRLLKTNTYLAQSHLLLDLMVFFAGGLLALAFAPLNIYLFAFISPMVLLFSLNDCSKWRAVWRGWLFGFAIFAVGASWIFVSIHTYGNTSLLLAIIITLGFVAFLALFFALMAFIFVSCLRSKHWLSSIIAFSCVWVLQEVFRSWFLTGFPWLLLGNSQLSTPLRGFAPIVSVYGVSFIVVSICGLLVHNMKNRTYLLKSICIVIVIFALGFGLNQIRWNQKVGKPISVSLIQGNISQTVKWNPIYLASTLQRYYDVTAQNISNSRLIVWPEGAIPDLLEQQQSYVSKLDKLAKQHHSAIITGIPINDKQQHFYNAAITLGDAYGVYMKRHLVPFGEYVPFESLLRGVIGFFDLPMSDFTPGPENQSLIKLDNINIATYLCYEIAYVNLVLHDATQANLLMNLSDDSWFGNSWAAAQQLQIAQMRSLETALQQIVATNSGYTAVIDSKGNITKQAPRDKVYVLHASVQPLKGFTPLVRIGLLPLLCVLFIITLFCFIVSRKKNKSSNPALKKAEID